MLTAAEVSVQVFAFAANQVGSASATYTSEYVIPISITQSVLILSIQLRILCRSDHKKERRTPLLLQ